MGHESSQDYESYKIARYFLHKAAMENMRIDALKLLKLVYIAHGWCLAALDRDTLGGREEVELSPFLGPIVPSVYKKLESSHAIRGDSVPESLFAEIDLTKFDDERVKTVLDHVWDANKRFSGSDLVELTDLPESPWRYQRSAKRVTAANSDATVANEDLKSYFSRKILNLIDAVATA